MCNTSCAKAGNPRKSLIFPLVSQIFHEKCFHFFRFRFFAKIRIQLQLEKRVLRKTDALMASIFNFELLSILFPLFLMILRIENFQNSKKNHL